MVTKVEVGQIWTRRDPEGTRVDEFVVGAVTAGTVTGYVTGSGKVLKASARDMKAGGRFTFVGMGKVPEKRERGYRVEKEHVREPLRVDHRAAQDAHSALVGAAIRAMREAAGMSVAALSRETAIDIKTMSKLEHGDLPCSLYRAALIAEALDCTIDDLSPVTVADERAA